MSLDNLSPERVCYVHCNFCNTILAVSVPCNTTPTVVTVRCGHCANLLSVNMGALLIQSLPLHQDPQKLQKQKLIYEDGGSNCKEYSSSSTTSGSSSSSISNNLFPHEFQSATNHQQPRLPPIRPPEKRQRVPSAYNRFIKEEIQRIKASNPDISHREAFSTAAKNWAHFPHIHFGLKLDANKQVQLEQAVAGEGPQKSHHGFY